MNNKFDELAKGLAQSVTRRQALRKFSAGLAGLALACLGLPNKAEAGGQHCYRNSCYNPCVRTCLNNGGTLSGCSTYCAASCGCILF